MASTTASSTFVGDLIIGYNQLQKAKELEKEAKLLKGGAQYQIPESVEQALALAKLQASQRQLPGQNIMEQRIGENISSGIGNIQKMAPSSSAALGAIGGVYGKGMENFRDLDIEASRQIQENLFNLQRVYAARAPYEEKEWKINKYDPYMQAASMSAQMKAAAGQNIISGFQAQEDSVWNSIDSVMGMMSGGIGGGDKTVETQPVEQPDYKYSENTVGGQPAPMDKSGAIPNNYENMSDEEKQNAMFKVMQQYLEQQGYSYNYPTNA